MTVMLRHGLGSGQWCCGQLTAYYSQPLLTIYYMKHLASAYNFVNILEKQNKTIMEVLYTTLFVFVGITKAYV